VVFWLTASRFKSFPTLRWGILRNHHRRRLRHRRHHYFLRDLKPMSSLNSFEHILFLSTAYTNCLSMANVSVARTNQKQPLEAFFE
jgi:hypothetical protein